MYEVASSTSLLKKLSKPVQESSDRQFQISKQNPSHPSLYLKKVGNYWLARIGMRYQALSVERNGNLLWFWIGTHANYDKLLDS